MNRRRRRAGRADMGVRIGSVELPNPVMTASGTAGHGAELGSYLDLGALGAVVVKSLSAAPWPGNPAPRLTPTPAGMLNAVGLQGPGVSAWLSHDLPDLLATGARVVASIWGNTIEEYRAAADRLADVPDGVVAVEVNLSCPNLHAGEAMFAHSAEATEAALAATAGCGRPRWAKLSPNVADAVPIVDAALAGGAEAVTLVNTLRGLAIDPASRRPRLATGAGGLSGAAIHPVAVRVVHEVATARPEATIVGAGGVVDGNSAAELVLAGATGIQVGTATFADPASPARVLDELTAWTAAQAEGGVAALVGGLR